LIFISSTYNWITSGEFCNPFNKYLPKAGFKCSLTFDS
jgi:hypothetical protein